MGRRDSQGDDRGGEVPRSPSAFRDAIDDQIARLRAGVARPHSMISSRVRRHPVHRPPAARSWFVPQPASILQIEMQGDGTSSSSTISVAAVSIAAISITTEAIDDAADRLAAFQVHDLRGDLRKRRRALRECRAVRRDGDARLLPERMIGRQGLLLTDSIQDIGHIVLGLMLVSSGLVGESTAAFGLYATGAIAMFFGAISLYQLGSFSVGYLGNTGVQISSAGCWFHLALAAICMVCGKMNTSSKQLFHE